MYNQRTFDSRWDLLCGEEARGPEGHVELEPLQPLEERLRETTGYEPFQGQQVTSPSRDNKLRALPGTTGYEPCERDRQWVTGPERERERTGREPCVCEREREGENRLRALRERERQQVTSPARESKQETSPSSERETTGYVPFVRQDNG